MYVPFADQRIHPFSKPQARSNVSLYDPAFTAEDDHLLATLDLRRLPDSENRVHVPFVYQSHLGLSQLTPSKTCALWLSFAFYFHTERGLSPARADDSVHAPLRSAAVRKLVARELDDREAFAARPYREPPERVPIQVRLPTLSPDQRIPPLRYLLLRANIGTDRAFRFHIYAPVGLSVALNIPTTRAASRHTSCAASTRASRR